MWIFVKIRRLPPKMSPVSLLKRPFFNLMVKKSIFSTTMHFLLFIIYLT